MRPRLKDTKTNPEKASNTLLDASLRNQSFSPTMKSFVCIALFALIAVAASTSTTPAEYAPLEGENYRRCVQIRDVDPCKEFPDGRYNICDVCHLGYIAVCTNHEISIDVCEVNDDGNGNKVRLVFDSHTQTCVAESSSCQTAL
ncbi:hypothetical protein RRG08_046722 [Elysia crispata]|uniref:Uncharacterized protein n=1 Tax=Elysia crispata TaxID=231223 RepID=A0AAE1DN74_9GAST|nr:hypothetical protein RRG08_046722 [Elysia crispata]